MTGLDPFTLLADTQMTSPAKRKQAAAEKRAAKCSERRQAPAPSYRLAEQRRALEAAYGAPATALFDLFERATLEDLAMLAEAAAYWRNRGEAGAAALAAVGIANVRESRGLAPFDDEVGEL